LLVIAGLVWPTGLLMTAVAVVSFVLPTARTHFLGDGMQLLSRLQDGGPPIRPWNPGAYFSQERLYRV